MKLPESRKERLQVFAIIGLSSIIVIWLLLQLVILRLVDSYRSNADALAELQRKLAAAQEGVKGSRAVKAANEALTAQILDLSERYVIKPVLGAYLLAISDAIERLAGESDVELAGIQEIGITKVPVGKDTQRKRALESYGVRISARGSFGNMVRFIYAFENLNPYLFVSALDLGAQPKTPEVHHVTLELQWPVWSDEAVVPGADEGHGPEESAAGTRRAGLAVAAAESALP